jgi:hypothetical protein
LAHQKSGLPRIKLVQPAPHVRPTSLLWTHLSARFVLRPSTIFEVQSISLFQVSLIQGLQFTPPGYISKGRPPPSSISFSLATPRAKARVSSLHPSRRSRGPSGFSSSSSSSSYSSSSSSSSSCKLEKSEREGERAEEEPDLSDLPQHCTFAATGSSLSNLQVL